MRETFTSLQTQAQNYCLNDTSTPTLTFIKSELNRSQRYIWAELQDYLTLKVQTSATVASQQYYHLPPDNVSIETVVITINSVKYSLTPVDSQKQWDVLNAIQIQPTALPKYFFERQRDFGIWPIPQTAYTITLTYNYVPIDMSQDDYTTGTVTCTHDSVTVTGAGATFATTWIPGAWFKANRPGGDGQFYKISSNTAGVLTLEEAYQGVTSALLTYVVGESSDLPPESHQLMPLWTAAAYFNTQRKDPTQATYYNNLFWTGDPVKDQTDKDAIGGLLGLKARYSKRSDDRIIRKNSPKMTWFQDDKLFATTIT